MPVRQTQRTFKDIQEEYDHLFEVDVVRDEDRAYRWFAKQLFREKRQVQRLLDIACGGGFFLRELGKKFQGKTDLVGIDLSGKALELAKKECPSASLLLSLGEALPFQRQTFQAMSCLGSLEHFLDISTAVREMKRIATQDALFFILVPNLFWYKDLLSVLLTGNRKTRNQTHERFSSLGEWRGLLKELGLAVVKTIKYNGIARNPIKQGLKDLLIPLRFSYHFLFICRQKS